MGRALERRRFEFLPDMASAQRVLILGEGDGRFLQAAAKRRAGADQVSFHHADARSWPPPIDVSYDLVITHFFLDCFDDEDLETLVPRLVVACSGECRWIVSEFRQPVRGMAAWRARLWIGGLYRLFGLVTDLSVRTLPNYGAILEKNGFERTKAVVTEAGLLTSEVWERRAIFAFDAPAGAPLHSRTPKS